MILASKSVTRLACRRAETPFTYLESVSSAQNHQCRTLWDQSSCRRRRSGLRRTCTSHRMYPLRGKGEQSSWPVVVPPSSSPWELRYPDREARYRMPPDWRPKRWWRLNCSDLYCCRNRRRGRQGSCYHQSHLGLCLGFAFQELRGSIPWYPTTQMEG
jgi:hypothetical protein